jgi:cytochrome oxidase Cu insertion factor (SCO1/SenC/PrrC family)
MSNVAKVTLTLFLAAATVRLAVCGDGKEKLPNPQTDFQAYTAHALRQHFPNIVLTNQDDKKVRLYDDVIKGKIVVIQFMFSNCERLCPMVTPNLVKVQKELEKQSPGKVNIVSISVDPDHDTPAVLKAYAKKFHVQPGWQFLTGRRQDIDWLRRELGLYYPEDQQFEHMNMLTVGREATGQWFTIRALNNPEVIAYTVRKIIPDTTSGRANPISAKHARSFAGN